MRPRQPQPFRHKLRAATALAVLLTAAAPESWAWGTEGHRLTALVAEHYLTPETRAAVRELLRHETLADIASWADDYRSQHGETAPWHYVDIPADAEGFDRTRDCPVSPIPGPSGKVSPWRDCVTDRILYFEGRLGDPALPAEQRAEALKFLVHLIGDVHQPFHAYGDDRGGNGVSLYFLGSRQCGTGKCNLHEVWDQELIGSQNLSEKKYLARLLDEIRDNKWDRFSGGSPVLWANQSHHYAVLGRVPNGGMVMHDYVAEEVKVVDAQLAIGGLRLATVLNRILTPVNENPERKPLPAPAPQ